MERRWEGGRPGHPPEYGDAPRGLGGTPGRLEAHGEGYDHQEQWERSRGMGLGFGDYRSPRGEGSRDAWGSLGGGYGELGFGLAGPRHWEPRGLHGTRPAPHRGPRGYRRPDESIYEDVCEVLTAEGRLDVRDVEVAVNDGEVTLSGSVADRAAKFLLEDLVAGVRGVADVRNELRVRGARRAA